MLKESSAYSSFSVNDIETAKKFYENVLGLEVKMDRMGINIHITNGSKVFVYQKEDHQPAMHTVLNFPVDDVDGVVDELTANGVEFEQLEFGSESVKTDKKGIMRGKSAGVGPDIAWFKDPAGNTFAVLND